MENPFSAHLGKRETNCGERLTEEGREGGREGGRGIEKLREEWREGGGIESIS